MKVGSEWLIQFHYSRVSELYSHTLGTENGHLCSLMPGSEDCGHLEMHYRIIENHETLETHQTLEAGWTCLRWHFTDGKNEPLGTEAVCPTFGSS